jgi:hypothetical protein
MTKVSIFLFIWLLASVTYANDTLNQLPRQDIYKEAATDIYEDYLNSVKLKDKLGSEHTLSAAEQRNIWLLTLGDFEYPPAAALRKDNVKDKYIKYDFSTLFPPKSDFLGYIAPNYHRVKIYFTSVSKDPANTAIYMVSGISIVGNNKCYFKGKIEVDSIREFRVMHFGVDDELKNTGIKVQGVLLGNYKFEESKENTHSGVFKGVMALFWYIDLNDVLHNDDIEYHYSDRYRNNQYVGTWTAYDANLEKICNWGECRIPFSGDLDIGAGEFSPNPKYNENGWKNFRP